MLQRVKYLIPLQTQFRAKLKNFDSFKVKMLPCKYLFKFCEKF